MAASGSDPWVQLGTRRAHLCLSLCCDLGHQRICLPFKALIFSSVNEAKLELLQSDVGKKNGEK